MSGWLAPGLAGPVTEQLSVVMDGRRPHRAELVSDRLLRRVLRFEVQGQLFYAKQNLFPGVRHRLRYALRSSPTQHELRVLQAASRRGLTVPRPVAERTKRGWLGPRLAVLVTEGLPEGAPLSARELFVAADLLSSCGVFHPDLHSDNVRRLVDGTLAFLDFQSSRVRRGRLPERLFHQMLAKAFHDAKHRDPGLDLEELIADLEVPQGVRLLAAVSDLERARLASRRRHFLRDSTSVQRTRNGWFGRRLSLRSEASEIAARIADGFVPAQSFEDSELGSCRLSVQADGRLWRVQGRGFRELWLRARLEAEDQPDREGPRIVAWDRNGPWPFATESLYISDSTGASCSESIRSFLERRR